MKRAFTALSVMVALSVGVTSAVASASPNDDKQRTFSEVIDDTIVGSRHSYSVPDVEKTVTTEDGMSVTLKKLNEHIFRRTPLTTNLFSHEVHVSMQGIAEVEGALPKSEHTLTTGYLIGCQIDASSPIKLKAQFPMKVNPFSPYFGFGHDTDTTTSRSQKDKSSDTELNLLGGGLGIGFSSGFSFSTKIDYWTTVRPGRIHKVPLATYRFEGNKTTWTDFQDLHLYFDGCPGNVSLRSYVEFVDGASIPGHFKQKTSDAERVKKTRIPRPPQIKFAEATEKLKRVENKALKLDSVEPDEKIKGIGDSNLDRFSTEKPEEKDEPETEEEKVKKDLAELGKPNIETLTSPYGDGTTDQIEGLKFTIHGDVRWMSTILPQTRLKKDRENKQQNIESHIAPAREYKTQLDTEFEKQRAESRTERNNSNSRRGQK
ncbi:MAG TPA: hypothetical protein GX530_05030 [Corynebacteriales bacterium]|nr:hypothetical protein [Mycobacteriales bacterium]